MMAVAVAVVATNNTSALLELWRWWQRPALDAPVNPTLLSTIECWFVGVTLLLVAVVAVTANSLL
jgi:hypothetical protein